MPWDAILSAAGGVGVAFIGAYYLFRGKRVDQEVAEGATEATAADAFLKGQVSFQTYVDGIVNQRVAAATAEVKAELAEMRQQMATMRQETHEMHDAFRSRETQLWLWEVRNRPGPMPTLPEPILRKLGLAHLIDFDPLADTEQILKGGDTS